MQRGPVLSRIRPHQRFFGAEDRSLVEKNDNIEGLASAIAERIDQDIHDLNAAGVAFERNALARTTSTGLDGFAESRSQIEAKPLTRQRQHLSRRRARGWFEVFSRL